MKNYIKIFLTGAIIATSSYATISSANGVVTFDIVNTALQMQKSIKDKIYAQLGFEEAAKKAQLDKELAVATSNSFNNGFANTISRQTQQKTELFNLALMGEFMPASALCGATSFKSAIDKVNCAEVNKLKQLNSDFAVLARTPSTAPSLASSSAGDSSRIPQLYGFRDTDNDGAITQFEIDQQIANRAIDRIQSGGSNNVSRNLVLSDQTMGPEEEQIAKDAVYLLTPSINTNNYIGDKSPSTDAIASQVKVERQNAYRSAIYNSLNGQLALRSSMNASEYSPSPLFIMKKQSEIFYGGDNPEETVAFKASLGKTATPTLMYRYLLSIQAYKANLQLNDYLQSLRDEQLQAMKLSQKINTM